MKALWTLGQPLVSSEGRLSHRYLNMVPQVKVYSVRNVSKRALCIRCSAHKEKTRYELQSISAFCDNVNEDPCLTGYLTRYIHVYDAGESY